ncbi:MAG TPA: protein kinase, partial [Candidatus Sulfotelmatobacter sp.]|nr:protein kinase [Candidatus Sulfotelmatobacter sp.]
MERYAGRFGLLKRLGKGGMGEVYLALDLSNGAEFALKRISRRADAPPPATLQREFEALARVRHPVVVRVIELGFDFEGAPFLLMEYVPGWPADEVLRPGDWSALYYVAARVAAGLEAIHAAGILHGDLKPSNVLVVPSPAGGRPRDVRIVDFGLAALRGRDAEGHRGTAGFTAPEVVRGEAPSPAADLYALGTTLYAIATGRAPFEGTDAGSVLRRQQAGPPSALALEEVGVPSGLAQLILQLTAPAAIERPRAAADVRRTLEALNSAARSSFAERLQSERLVGRDLELSRLDREWRRAAKTARALFLRGDAGVGKSALLAELANRGQMDGRSVIRLVAAAASEPGAVWRQLLRRLAADARVDITDALESRLREALDSPGAENDEAALSALVARACEWCKAIAARGAPTAVIVDDSENLDPASRSAMRRLMLAAEAAPALWVIARRVSGEDAPEDERLLTAAHAAAELRLAPLTKADIGALMSARLQVEAPAALVDVAWERAAGHPGLTLEWLRSAAQAGGVLEDDFGVRVDADRLATVPIAAGFEASRLERLMGLPSESQRAAEVLAFCQRPRAIEYLRRVAPELGERDLERLLEEGLAGRDAEGGWTLSPPALATPLRQRTGAERRQELHRAILAAGELGALEEYRHR